MNGAQVMAEIRKPGIVAVLAAGLALVAATPAPAEVEPAPATPVCGTDQPGNDEPWAVPPERGRSGEPY